MIPVLSSKKASELPVDEVASILQVSDFTSLKNVLMLPNNKFFLKDRSCHWKSMHYHAV